MPFSGHDDACSKAVAKWLWREEPCIDCRGTSRRR